jgi:hypothetical protein
MQGTVDGSTGEEELAPRTTDRVRSARDSGRAVGSHPSYWDWLLSGGRDRNGSAAGHGHGTLKGSAAGNGQMNGNGSLNGHVNGNGRVNGHANGQRSLNGNGSINGHGPAIRRAVKEMALEGMTPTGLARRLGRG